MLLSLLLACTGSDLDTGSGPPTAVDLSPLELTWAPAASGIDADALRTGIDWNLSLLGAMPPADGAHLVIEEGEGLWLLELDLAAAGFPGRAHPALTAAVDELRSPDGPFDAGRFFMLTLHEPWRYYSITGACGQLAAWQQVRRPEQTDRYDVTESLLSGGDRVVLLPPDQAEIQAVAFLVATGGEPLGPDWVAQEYETVDLMANAQQRFATYDGDGWLQPAADPAVVPAGQPGKCQWCHEDHLMSGTPTNPGGAPGIETTAWLDRLEAWQEALEGWRGALPTSIDFVDSEAHTQGELVVREFLRPTLDRVATEWGLPEEEARALVEARGLVLEEDEEWPHRGEVLLRSEVDAVLVELSGRVQPPVLEDARELAPDADLRGREWAAWLDCPL